jgi:hypothetical protein
MKPSSSEDDAGHFEKSERFLAAEEKPGSETFIDDDGDRYVLTAAGDKVWNAFTVFADGNSELHANIDYDPENRDWIHTLRERRNREEADGD